MILPRVTVLIICADIWSMHMKKVIILLDEYDTPMQEANVYRLLGRNDFFFA